MTTRRANARKNGEYNVEQEVPLQAPQALIRPLGENVTQAVFRSSFQVLAQVVMAQNNR